MKLAAVKSPLFRLLEITRLNEVFQTYPSVEAALQAFREDQAAGKA